MFGAAATIPSITGIITIAKSPTIRQWNGVGLKYREFLMFSMLRMYGHGFFYERTKTKAPINRGFVASLVLVQGGQATSQTVWVAKPILN